MTSRDFIIFLETHNIACTMFKPSIDYRYYMTFEYQGINAKLELQSGALIINFGVKFLETKYLNIQDYDKPEELFKLLVVTNELCILDYYSVLKYGVSGYRFMYDDALLVDAVLEAGSLLKFLEQIILMEKDGEVKMEYEYLLKITNRFEEL